MKQTGRAPEYRLAETGHGVEVESMNRMTSQTNAPESPGQEFYDRMPGLREAIEQRIAECPEYRVWLQHHGPAVLQGLKNSAE